MRLIAIPLDDEALKAWAPAWLPFLPGIARRTKETVQALAAQVMLRQTRITLIWNDDTNKPDALIGVRLHMRGGDLIAELPWVTGRNYKAWIHLLPELEDMLRTAGAVEVRPLCRPGWRKLLEAAGYRVTHLQMEKSLAEKPNGRFSTDPGHAADHGQQRPVGTVAAVSAAGDGGGKPAL